MEMIRRERQSYGLKRRLAILIGLAGLSAYAIGLVAFIGALERIGSEPKSADAIVALTGGDARLDKAMSLLAERRGTRLLITGVNNTVTRDELKRQIGGPRSVYACCVDLGRGASNTIENAVEAAAWVRRHNYRSIIVVTAAYHLPRSLMEFRAALPGVKLVGQPVFPRELDMGDWWQDRDAAWLLMSEYTKYLTSWVRLNGLEPLGFRFHQGVEARIEYGGANPGDEPILSAEPKT